MFVFWAHFAAQNRAFSLLLFTFYFPAGLHTRPAGGVWFLLLTFSFLPITSLLLTPHC
jgi:hypothetical protein